MKLAVRALPPCLSAAEFYEAVGAASEGAVFTMYAQGVAAGAVHAGSAAFASVAYAAFERPEAADAFYDAIHGSRFVDEGVGSVCVAEVEFAMSQALPRPVKKACLAAAGAMEHDPDYLSFVKAYEEDGRSEKAARTAAPSLADTDALFGEAGLARAETGKKDALAKRRALASGKRAASAAPVVLTPLMEEIRSKRRSSGSKRGGAVASKGSRRTKRGVVVKNPGDPDPPPSETAAGRSAGRGEDVAGRRCAARAEARKAAAAAAPPSAVLQREGRGGGKASRSGRSKLTVVDPVTKAPVILGATARGTPSKKQAQAQARRQRQRVRAAASAGCGSGEASAAGAAASGEGLNGGSAGANGVHGAGGGASVSNDYAPGMPAKNHGSKYGAPDVASGTQLPLRLLTKAGRVQDGGTG